MAEKSGSEPEIDKTSIIARFEELSSEKQEALNAQVEIVAEKEGRII
ncbi:Uncharacterised protein [uncultured archaeon]|nr:Uncharacterised protein [uncultured archaeon]